MLGLLLLAITFPSKEEPGKKPRIQISLPEGPELSERHARATETAQAIVKGASSAKGRARLARRAARSLEGCQSAPESEGCRRYRKLIVATLAGRGSERVNGRPFTFVLDGFTVRAGLSDAPLLKASDGDTEHHDPVIRLRALLRAQDRMKDASDAFRAMGPEARRAFVDQGVDDSDVEVRRFALENVEVLPLDKMSAVIDRALEDPDPDVRFKAIPHAPRLGEPFMRKATRDSHPSLRMQAYDTVVDYFLEKGDKASAMPYLERALGDSEAEIRNWASGKIGYLDNP